MLLLSEKEKFRSFPVGILMGVSGSGKSALGRLLAKDGWADFVEGDDFHSQDNLRKMASGQPLEDADRWPWLEALGREVALRERTRPLFVSCSALKEVYRRYLEEKIGERVWWFFLNGPKDVLEKRLLDRDGHFMKASMLASQIETLERPHENLELDITRPLVTLRSEVISHLNL